VSVDELAAGRGRWPRHLARPDPETLRREIREQYSHTLWDDLLDHRLTREQEDALVAALLGVLDGDGPRRSGAIWPLGKSGRRDVIPPIVRELRAAIGHDAWAVHQAAYTLADLLYVDRGRRLSRAMRAVFHDAIRALGEAVTPDRPYPPSTPETGYIPDPREAVVQTLDVLCGRFTPPARRAGLPRRRRDHPWVMGRVAAAVPTPTGDVAVFGPLRASLTIGHFDVQLPATVTPPDGPTRPAAYVGRLFDLSAWPPRTAVLLRGVAPEELEPGVLFTADASEANAMLRASADGSLQREDAFSEVVRAGLGADQLILVFPAPDRVYGPSPPGTPMNQSILDFHRRLDEVVARPRRKQRAP